MLCYVGIWLIIVISKQLHFQGWIPKAHGSESFKTLILLLTYLLWVEVYHLPISNVDVLIPSASKSHPTLV